MSGFEELDLAKGKNAGTRASMQNVAAYAGVSIATVSKVMQGVSTVLPENVTKVQNAIEALGYRINPLGAELRRGRRNLIGLIVPSLEDAATARLVTELELAVEARGHVLFVGSSHGSAKREAELANRMQDWRVSGVIVLSVEGPNGAADLLIADAGIAAVFVEASDTSNTSDTLLTSASSKPKDIALRAVAAIFARLEAPDGPLIRDRV